MSDSGGVGAVGHFAFFFVFFSVSKLQDSKRARGEKRRLKLVSTLSFQKHQVTGNCAGKSPTIFPLPAASISIQPDKICCARVSSFWVVGRAGVQPFRQGRHDGYSSARGPGEGGVFSPEASRWRHYLMTSRQQKLRALGEQ